MKTLLFVGSYAPSYMLDNLMKIGAKPDFAAINFQEALISGLDNLYKVNIITIPSITSFPKIKKLLFKQESFGHFGNEENDKFVGLLNVPLIKMVDKLIRLRREIKKYFKTNPDSEIVVYGLHSPFLLATCLAKRKINKSCVIIPDLPEYMSDRKTLLFKLAKRIDRMIITRCLKSFDKYVVLSPKMQERLLLVDTKVLCIEGIFNDSKISGSTEEIKGILPIIEDSKIKSIMYAGGIQQRYGLSDLINAFRLIPDENFRFVLCGNIAHDEKNYFLDLISKDNRIIYLGLLKKHDIQLLESKVTLLVNPRHKSEIFTKYSFPSKTMEYLASGRPTLMSHLESIPKDYDDNLFYFTDESVEGMAKDLVRILSLPVNVLKEKGRLAKDFILSQKNEQMQARRLYEFMQKR